MDDSTQPNLEPAQPAPPAPVDYATAQQAPAAVWQAQRTPLPGSVVGAAVVLLVMGVLVGLMGALFLLSGSIYQQLPDSTFSGFDPAEIEQMRTVSQTFATVFGIVTVALALAHLASGIGIFRRGGWARILGLVMGGLGVLFGGLFLIIFLIGIIGGFPITDASLSTSGLTREQFEQTMRIGLIFGGVVVGVVFAAYLFTLIALGRNGRAFG